MSLILPRRFRKESPYFPPAGGGASFQSFPTVAWPALTPPPVAASWTALNSATLNTTAYSLADDPAGRGPTIGVTPNTTLQTGARQIAYIAAPVVPFTITALINFAGAFLNFGNGGIFLLDSGLIKQQMMGVIQNGNSQWIICEDHYVSLTDTGPGQTSGMSYPPVNSPLWLRVKVLTGLLTYDFSVSFDGQNWIKLFAAKAISTIGAIASIGWGIVTIGSPISAGVGGVFANLLSWSVTTP